MGHCCLVFVNALLFQCKTRQHSSVMHVSIKKLVPRRMAFRHIQMDHKANITRVKSGGVLETHDEEKWIMVI